MASQRPVKIRRIDAPLGSLAILLVMGAIFGGQNGLSAQDSTDRAKPDWEARAGAAYGLVPGGLGVALHAGVQTTRGTGRSRWIVGAQYGREIGSHGACCGPNPGYSYQLEALELSVGAEVSLFERDDWHLALEGRATPTWTHSIRHGSQADFQPGPTTWHLNPDLFGVGAVARAPLSTALYGIIRVQLRQDFEALLHGFVRPAWNLEFGIGW